MHYCRPGPGCDVHLWKGSGIWCARFGAGLAHDSGGCVTTESLDLFLDLVGALKRAGFRIPGFVFTRLDAEVKERDEAIAAEKARQIDMFALPQPAVSSSP